MLKHDSNKRRLLVLDDEQNVANTICLMASTLAYQTDHTDNVDVFFEKVEAWSPSHVMVDLLLPRCDGIEVLKQLAEMNCHAEVIIISGLTGRILSSAASVAIEKGLCYRGSLPKPFSRAELKALLEPAQQTEESVYATLTESYPSAISADQIADAIESESFIAHFQPKISCVSGKLVGFECLARWPQNDGSMVSPDKFVCLAEQTGLIHRLTRQVYIYILANISTQFSKSDLKFAMNLSPLNLNDDTFPQWLMNECRAHDIHPSQIIIEITETASIDKPLALLETLTQFRIHGFQVSIDDFGVGYSSLVQLARLPFSELKIDQMFVKNLVSSEESLKIVKSIIGLGKSLGLTVVAEGVEDEQALKLLQELGCDEAQGYYIAKPMDIQLASSWVDDTKESRL